MRWKVVLAVTPDHSRDFPHSLLLAQAGTQPLGAITRRFRKSEKSDPAATFFTTFPSNFNM